MIARVMIESPYAGDIERNVRYARRAMRHSLMCGEAPFAMHLLYTQEGILDDSIVEERNKGIGSGLKWLEVANYVAVYQDYGITEGMKLAIICAETADKVVTYREIGRNDEPIE